MPFALIGNGEIRYVMLAWEVVAKFACEPGLRINQRKNVKEDGGAGPRRMRIFLRVNDAFPHLRSTIGMTSSPRNAVVRGVNFGPRHSLQALDSREFCFQRKCGK